MGPRRVVGVLLVLLALLAAVFVAQRGRGVPVETATVPTYAGSASCRTCHAEAYEKWRRSHHGLAERPVDPAADRGAFEPSRTIAHGTQSSEARVEAGRLTLLMENAEKTRQPFTTARVIGVEPLRQFLVPTAGGRYQATELAFDPAKDEWFDVFGDEDRKPGEWGHWTGRGMNWNFMCASCHNTALHKGYDTATDTYATTMAEAGVGCEACHGPMGQHVAWQQATPARAGDPHLRSLTPAQTLDACGSCHSRRSELTGTFVPGDLFLDHYVPTIPDETPVYHADGQVHEEDYEYVSFLGSRMHVAGVTCQDCHDPHSGRTLHEGNPLCQRCHDGRRPPAPAIDPATHSHHEPDTPGGRCVDCHMPETVYMQRDPRRDHGFTIPDPALTRTHGVPNACSRCHKDRTPRWAEDAMKRWYADVAGRASQQRARTMARARTGAPMGERVAWAAAERHPLWRAVAIGLLRGAGGEADAVLPPALSDEAPLVRAMAARALEPRSGDPEIAEGLRNALGDPVRAVRVEAAWALRKALDPASLAATDLDRFLAHNEDQPTGAMQKGVYALDRGDAGEAVRLFRRAVAWDPSSAPFHHALALGLSVRGDPKEAVTALESAARLDPNNAEYQYHLGLGLQDVGEPLKGLDALKDAVRLQPRWPEAWYDLARCYAALGRTAEAREAAQRALVLRPSWAPARTLLAELEKG